MGPMVMVVVPRRRKVDVLAMMMAIAVWSTRSRRSLKPDQSDRHCAEDCRQFRDTTHCWETFLLVVGSATPLRVQSNKQSLPETPPRRKYPF
jgi:hypothetical protein